ncbi:hypothetical protein KBY23_08335 [Ruegeria pomeroyi]|nr:hypothetical protein [Ruegeria pomeroyi]
MIFAFVLVFLGVVAIFPLILISLNRFQGSFLERLTSFLDHYDSILMSVGTLFVVSGLAVLAARIASQSVSGVEAENRKNRAEMAKIQLKTTKEIKLAEFRQVWINEMRREVAEYVSLTTGDMMAKNFEDDGRRERLAVLSSQIFLRLNPTEPLSAKLAECIRKIADARRRKDISALNELLREFASVSREILKGEWKRLKDDLDEAIKETGAQS